jgi:hypothetical protein
MKNIRIMSFAFLAVLFVCLSVPAATLPKAAKLVPPQTALLVETDSFSRLQQQFEKTPFFKFYKDSSMAGFVENVKQDIRKEVDKLDDNNLFKAFYNAGLLPQGRVAFALVLDDRTKDANEPPVLIITQWAENIDKIKEVVKKLVQKNIDMGGRQKPIEDYRGASIETLIDEQKTPLSYCFIDDCLLASPDPEILKFAIARLKGSDGAALADDADYSAGFTAAGPYHDIDFFVNIKQFIKMAIADDSSGETKKYIGSFGLDNVRSLSGSLGFARLSGGATVGKALLKIDGDKKGVCKMLDLRSASIQAPAFIPSSAYSVSVFNLDIKAAYDELVKIVGAISPAAASVFYTPLVSPSEEGGPSIELKKDIVNYLGSQIVSAEWSLKSSPEKIAESEGVVAVAISNRSILEKNLALLHDRFIARNQPDAKRDLLGHTIYVIDLFSSVGFHLQDNSLIEANAEQNISQIPKMAFTVTDTHLIVGSEPAVETAIRLIGNPGSASIGSEQWFSTAKSAIPSAVGVAGFSNITGLWEKLWQVLRQGTDSQREEIMSGPLGTQAILPPLSEGAPFFKLLPAFEAVRKYFGLTAFYGISRPDGFYFELQYITENP